VSGYTGIPKDAFLSSSFAKSRASCAAPPPLSTTMMIKGVVVVVVIVVAARACNIVCTIKSMNVSFRFVSS